MNPQSQGNISVAGSNHVGYLNNTLSDTGTDALGNQDLALVLRASEGSNRLSLGQPLSSCAGPHGRDIAQYSKTGTTRDHQALGTRVPQQDNPATKTIPFQQRTAFSDCGYSHLDNNSSNFADKFSGSHARGSHHFTGQGLDSPHSGDLPDPPHHTPNLDTRDQIVHFRKSCLLEEQQCLTNSHWNNNPYCRRPLSLTSPLLGLHSDCTQNTWMDDSDFEGDKIRNLPDDVVSGGGSGGGLPPVSYEGSRAGVGGTGPLDTSHKGSPQRVPPSTHPGPPPGFSGGHNGHPPPAHLQQGPPQQGHMANKNQQFCHTLPESPPDSGSEPYSPPNHRNQQPGQDPPPYNVKGNESMPPLAPGGHHPMYLHGGHGPPTGPLHPHGPPTGAPNIHVHSSLSPPHGQHQSPPHPMSGPGMQLPIHPPGGGRPMYNPMYPLGSEPPRLQHPGPMPLNVQALPGLPNSQSRMNNLSNQVAKKRKHESPNSTINQQYLHQMAALQHPADMLGIKQEPGILDCDDDYSYDMQQDPGMFMEGTFQVIKWQNFQQSKWVTLLDDAGKEYPSINYRVDADKGFNYSPSDESFVCQKKNHFQVTVHISLSGYPKFIKTPEGAVKPFDCFKIHFNGIKAESTSQTIRIEQSQSDRTKKAFHPVKVDLMSEQVNKYTVGRLHFSETTSNNMRKKGKPNPDQRYFMLVVSLNAYHGQDTFLVAAQKSERIIVRASNPGQFEGDMDVPWNKGRTPDSVVHLGRVGINTESPNEALSVVGNIQLTGHVIQTSDKRAKTNIKELDTKEQLQNISKLKVCNYAFDNKFAEYVGMSDDEKQDTGVIAQELQTVLPDAVKETGDVLYPDGERIEKLMVVNKDRIYMENVGAVKELCKVTDKLETRINEIEGMNKKLSKMAPLKRDSMKSTCSTYSYSTCSTISRTNSMPPEKEKPKPKKKNETSSENNSSSNTRSSRCHHHHSRQSHHNHHSSSHRHGNSSSAESGDSGPCNNKLIQIVVIILVLVMAFCLVAITTLYVLEKRKNDNIKNYFTTPSYTNQGSGPPNETSNLSSTTFLPPTSTGPSLGPFDFSPDARAKAQAVPEADINNTRHAVPLIPPQCLQTVCPVVCCTGSTGPINNDPGQGVPDNTVTTKPTGKNEGHPNEIDKDKDPNPNPPYQHDQILPGDGSQPSPGQQKYNVPSEGPEERQMDYYDDPSPRDGPHIQPNSNRIPKDPHPNSTKQSKPKVVVDRSGTAMNDPAVVDNEIIDDIHEDIQNQPEISNQPQIIVVNTGNHKYYHTRRKRDLNIHNHPARLKIKQIDKIIDSIYCADDNCESGTGGNYSYYIPISRVFPLVFITIEFEMISDVEDMVVTKCKEEENDRCNLPSDPNGDVPINATMNMENIWDLPVGFYLNSYFKFRIASKDEQNICSRSVSEKGHTYSEYNLRFHRVCE